MALNKNAVVMRYLVLAVVALVVIVVVLPYFSSIKAASEKAGIRFACEQSLRGQNNLRLFTGGLASKTGSPVKLNCPTEYLKIRAEGEALKREIADHLYDCFSLYDKKYDLFSQETGTYCIICKSLEMKNSGVIEGLVDFLRAARIPAREGRTTYLAYFGGEGSLDIGAQQIYNNYPFDEGKSIAVIITYGSKGLEGDRIILKSEVGLGMLIHPYDNVGELGCYSFEGKTTSLEYKGAQIN